VIVSAQSYDQVPQLEQVISGVEGVNSHTVILAYNTELVAYTDSETGETYNADELRQRLREANVDFPPAAFFDGTAEEKDEIQQEILDALLLNAPIESRSQLGDTGSTFVSGRDLTEADAGQPVLILQENELLNAIGLSAGDTVTLNVVNQGMFGSTSEEVTFEIVGVRAEAITVSFGSPYYAPAGAFPENVPPSTVTIMVDVNEESIPALRRELAQVPGTFVIETSIITQLFTSLLGTFTAFPTMVAALGLIVGGVVIANSVALATMERRHEIAVMKSVGLQRERVLGMLLLENGILGFIGGLMGVGYGLIALSFMSAQLQAPLTSIPFGLAFLLMLLCVVVALIAAITSAWDASGEKPLTVLRYE
jgi:ABC-type antimicrobial peptide transport system permease subunit